MFLLRCCSSVGRFSFCMFNWVFLYIWVRVLWCLYLFFCFVLMMVWVMVVKGML